MSRSNNLVMYANHSSYHSSEPASLTPVTRGGALSKVASLGPTSPSCDGVQMMKQALGFDLTRHLPRRAVPGPQAGGILKDWPWCGTALIRTLQRPFI